MSRYGTWLVDIFVLLVVIGPSACPRQLGGQGLVGVVGQTPPARTEIEVCKKLDKARGYKDDRCGKKWGVFQTARVAEFWVVHEVEFFWDMDCTVNFPAGLAKSSTQNRARTMSDATNSKVWDKDDDTFWASECNVITGGCIPWKHYVGKQIGEGGTPIVTDPSEPFATLRCLRLLQSRNATRYSSSIATAVWLNDTESGYQIIEEYGELSGGFWNRRPAYEAGLWRLWNGDPTARPWEVAEIMFYSDVFCTKEVFGVPISSSSFGVPQTDSQETYCYDRYWGCPSVPGCPCDLYVPEFASNGVRYVGTPFPDPLPAFWKAPCHPNTGCPVESAWLGLDLGETPRAVNCIRIYQNTFDGWPIFGYPVHTTRLTLQGWTGFQWLTVNSFPGLGHGNWSDTRPKEGYAWRIQNFDQIPESWKVYEMALYEEEHCGMISMAPGQPGVRAGGVSGIPVDVNEILSFSEQEAQCRLSEGSCSPLAFDQKVQTAWVSTCSPCKQREAWIGVMSRTRAWNIKCFRLYQSPDKLHRTEAVELSRWDGDKWVVERFEGGVGGGTWNYRPADAMTSWRVIGMSETVEPWTVAGLLFYADGACSGNPVEATTIAVGHAKSFSSEKAMDFDPEGLTEWVVSCTAPRPGSQGCAPGAAWIGVQSTGTKLQVNCVRLKQHRLKAKQISFAILEVFNGITWEAAGHVPPLVELGGGSWQTLPGTQASMWRIAARPIAGGFGVGFSEVGFYRTPDCSGDPIRVNFPNIAGIAAGHSTGGEVVDKTGYTAHLEIIDEVSESAPGFAFDGDYSTFWCDLDMLSPGTAAPEWQTWIGLDMTSQVSDVMCVRFATAPVLSLQPAWAELQGWDGRVWTTQASVATKPTLVVPLPSPMASGWQRRPEQRRANWRIENVMFQQDWEVLEIQFYDRIDCNAASRLSPHNTFASAWDVLPGTKQGGHKFASKAFDGSLDTRWKAYCPPAGCQPGQAWIGAGYLNTVNVRCFKIYQSGRYEKQARTLQLSTWMGDRWVAEAKYAGLGGNSWNMRPAAPDTLWRMIYMGRAEEDCATLPKRPLYHRSWGIAEFHFYADDECTEELQGQILASGSWEDTASLDRVDDNLMKATAPDKAQDGDETTFWAANCKSTNKNPRARCDPGEEWIGLDVGQKNGGIPVEVRCIKIKQARALQQVCCDPASQVRLDRWNGSAWAEASWRHLDQMSPDEFTLIKGGWINLGQCPSPQDKKSGMLNGPAPGIWERRARRQTDSCEIPLSAAVKLITDPLCAQHPACVEAGFGTTMYGCCPLSGSGVISKCCCDIPQWKIFEDQWDLGIDRKPIEPFPVIGIEYVIIKLINVMPWIGILVTLAVYFLATMKRPRRIATFKYRVWNATCGPVQRWLRGNGTAAAFATVFLQRRQGERFIVTAGKRLAVVLGGFVIGGSSLWILLAMSFAQVLSRIMMLISRLIKVCRSPYSPKEPSERKRLMLFLEIPAILDGNDKEWEGLDLATVLAGFVTAAAEAFAFIVVAIADIIILRFAFMNLGVVDVRVSVPDILYQMPTLDLKLDFVSGNVYFVLHVGAIGFTEAFIAAFEGVPRCEGPVLVFSGMWLVAISVVLIRSLNYDYFGLLMAARQTTLNTRPMFQRIVAVITCLTFQSCVYMGLQVAMLMFSRALSLLSGVQMTSTEASEGWHCPYDGEAMSIVIGRIFLIISASAAILVTFVAANGHLLGRKQIVGHFGQQCGLDLDALHDTGESLDNPKLLRTTSFLSIFPTSLGFWFDWWNVEGYQIETRSRVYADQLGFPIPCPHCGTTHMPYEYVMRATALQVSLAWQLIPFIGPIIGKLAERCNNPPFYYRGTKLKCFWPEKNLAAVRQLQEHKSSFGFKIKYGCALAVAFIKDYGLPTLGRVAAVAVYVTTVYCTYTIDKENLETLGALMFNLVFALSFLAGYLLDFLPYIVLLILGAAVGMLGKSVQHAAVASNKFSSTASNITEKVEPTPTLWPLIGQVIHGVSLGGACSIYFLREWKDKDLSVDFVQLSGAAIGLASGWLVLVVAYVAEIFGTGRMFVNGFYWVYSIGIALWISFWVAQGEALGVFCVLCVIIGGILLYVSGMSFRPPVIDPADHTQGPSATKPLLTSVRAVSGPFGIYAGVFALIMPYDFMVSTFGKYLGTSVAFIAGYAAGLIYAFATHVLCESRPGQRAMIVGTGLTVLIGVLFHWVVGAGFGVIVGILIGMHAERQFMKEVNKMSLEPPRYTKSKVMSAPVLTKLDDPDRWKAIKEPYGSALCEEKLEESLALPTVVRAETPTRNNIEHLALDDNFATNSKMSHLVSGAELAVPVSFQEAVGGSGPSRDPAAAYGRARRPKKYAFSESAKIVVPQGTPGYQVGQSKWEGPPREKVDYSAHLYSLNTSPVAGDASTSPSPFEIAAACQIADTPTDERWSKASGSRTPAGNAAVAKDLAAKIRNQRQQG